MLRSALIVSLLVTVATAQVSKPQPDPDPSRLGGVATVRDAGPNSFGYPVPTLTAKQRRAFAVGNAFFKDNWITAPASAAGRDGLGPLFNARSCSSCHLRDGRGRPPVEGEAGATGLVLRLGWASKGADLPHPVYGSQLQDQAILGVRPEGRVQLRFEGIPGKFDDGTEYELRKPIYDVVATAYGELGSAVTVGPRVAPQLIGLGLLEAVPVAEILTRADPEDQDGDGISGRPHFVRDPRSGARSLGRFGWKATEPTLASQIATAFAQDIGITSTLVSNEALTATQRRLIEFTSGGSPELSDAKLERVAFYCRALAVPAQRTPTAVRRGRQVFDRLGCASCHIPTLVTGKKAALQALADQRFHPFTDLLLHDMGDALADTKRDGDARPAEWRTPPLWGIGLFATVSGHTRYLHDGRARSLTEAILWHGGEAARAQWGFRAVSRKERDALLTFLQSL